MITARRNKRSRRRFSPTEDRPRVGQLESVTSDSRAWRDLTVPALYSILRAFQSTRRYGQFCHPIPGLLRLEQEENWRPSPAALAQFGELVRLIRQDAKAAGMDRITTAEIDAEVEAARKGNNFKTKKARYTSQK
jgi:hypothetical protein